MGKDCPLCRHERVTRHYYEDDLIYICDCKTCRVPMVVLKEHRGAVAEGERREILDRVREIFGEGARLRGSMRSIRGHWHDHIMV